MLKAEALELVEYLVFLVNTEHTTFAKTIKSDDLLEAARKEHEETLDQIYRLMSEINNKFDEYD